MLPAFLPNPPPSLLSPPAGLSTPSRPLLEIPTPTRGHCFTKLKQEAEAQGGVVEAGAGVGTDLHLALAHHPRTWRGWLGGACPINTLAVSQAKVLLQTPITEG